MKNLSLIRNLSLASAVSAVLLSACAHDNDKTSKADDHNLSQNPLPTRVGAGDEHNLTAREPAPVAATPAGSTTKTVAPTEVTHDRCKPAILSSGAVGQPCLTTAEFISSLNLGRKKQAQALDMVKNADRALAH